MTVLSQNLIPLIPGGDRPVLLRARYVRRVVDQVNRNTAAVRQPTQIGDLIADELARMATFNDIGEVSDVEEDGPLEKVVLTEQSRTTSTVRVTNPDDSDQYVDVERIETILMLGDDLKFYELVFDND